MYLKKKKKKSCFAKDKVTAGNGVEPEENKFPEEKERLRGGRWKKMKRWKDEKKKRLMYFVASEKFRVKKAAYYGRGSEDKEESFCT